MESQNSFSKLFEKNRDNFYFHKPNGNSIEYPFSFIENYFSNNFESNDLIEFNNGLRHFKELKELQISSYTCFEYELSLLESHKTEYINEVVSKLIQIKQKIRNYSHVNKYTKPYYTMLSTIGKNILENIFISYHLDLNSENRMYLSKWFYLKEPVISFRLIKYPEDKNFEIIYNEYLRSPINGFISYETSFSTFKSIFEGRTLVNKINWIDKKSSLYYFIKLLIKEKVIRSTKNKHWAIASEFFLLNGETLIPRDFLNQKETQDTEKRKRLQGFVSELK